MWADILNVAGILIFDFFCGKLYLESVDRPLTDKLFDAVPYTFKPALKNSGNPNNKRIHMCYNESFKIVLG